MKAIINGTARELPGELTIGALLELLGSARDGVAVARNERVVRRTQFDLERVCDGDSLEIIEAVAGG